MEAKKHFYRISSAAEVGVILAARISDKLKTGPVLWLLSGGSAADVAVACAKRLAKEDLSKLIISLADERYGPPGHAGSNWRRLQDSGFKLPGAKSRPFLSGEPFDQTVSELNRYFANSLAAGGYKIALLGMGADGHTAGILPASPAVGSKDLIVGYQAGDYLRLTLGFEGIKKLDEAILYCVGGNKGAQLDSLASSNTDPAAQPAQIIKSLPAWTVYNDRIGEVI